MSPGARRLLAEGTYQPPRLRVGKPERDDRHIRHRPCACLAEEPRRLLGRCDDRVEQVVEHRKPMALGQNVLPVGLVRTRGDLGLMSRLTQGNRRGETHNGRQSQNPAYRSTGMTRFQDEHDDPRGFEVREA